MMKKKLMAVWLALALCLGVAGCESRTQTEIAMVPNTGTIDDESFNQETWEGIHLYAGIHGRLCNYYLPAGQSDEAYFSAIKKAVQNGAEVVVLPGHAFQYVVGQAQAAYPDTHFILLDAVPADGAGENTVGIVFAEEQAGYLAGYAAVMDGYRALGFIGGMPVPGVTGYGFGYVQGAAAAAKELGETVEMRYTYNGQFEENDAARQTAADWYEDGTEVIFACGGGMNLSVFAAAEEAEGKTIGVDADQSGVSNTVIVSAVKELGAAAGQTLEQFYAGDFPGGETLVMDAGNGTVGLAMENARFTHFSAQDYEALLEQIKMGNIEIVREKGGEEPVSPLDLGLELPYLELDYIVS